MAIFGSSSGSSGNVDEIKSTIIKQLQQEAAVNNARQLIGVRYTLSPFKPGYTFNNMSCSTIANVVINTNRKSTNTASTSAFPPPARLSRPPKKAVSRRAWRSTFRCGTLLARATLRALERRARSMGRRRLLP